MPGSIRRYIWAPLMLWLLLGCEAREQVAPLPVIRPVRTEQVSEPAGRTTRTFAGAARAGEESKLSFRVAGTLVAVAVKVGDRVKRGQLIASLESRDFALQVQEAKAGLAQAEAQARNLSAQHERVKALYENSNASQAELDAARSAAESARAGVAAAKKRVELAASQAAYTRLEAPSDGVVARVNVEKNENVSPGQAIVVVNSDRRLEVEIAVPESLIGSVAAGQKATVHFDALAGESLEATVTEVGVAPERTATTFPVVLTLAKQDDRVRPGMATEVTLGFESPEGEAGLFVNPKAIGEDRRGRFAFVAVPQEPGFAKVERREVEVGKVGARGLEIKKGLEPGELLVVAGLSYLEQGMRVRLLDQPKAAPTPSSKPASSALP